MFPSSPPTHSLNFALDPLISAFESSTNGGIQQCCGQVEAPLSLQAALEGQKLTEALRVAAAPAAAAPHMVAVKKKPRTAAAAASKAIAAAQEAEAAAEAAAAAAAAQKAAPAACASGRDASNTPPAEASV